MAFRSASPSEDARNTEALVGSFTWGQFSFWVAARWIKERPDLLGEVLEKEVGHRRDGPRLVRIGGRPFASTLDMMRASAGEFHLPVFLWLDSGAVRGLRCVHRLGRDESASVRIEALLLTLAKS